MELILFVAYCLIAGIATRAQLIRQTENGKRRDTFYALIEGIGWPGLLVYNGWFLTIGRETPGERAARLDRSNQDLSNAIEKARIDLDEWVPGKYIGEPTQAKRDDGFSAQLARMKNEYRIAVGMGNPPMVLGEPSKQDSHSILSNVHRTLYKHFTARDNRGFEVFPDGRIRFEGCSCDSCSGERVTYYEYQDSDGSTDTKWLYPSSYWD